MKTMKLNLLEKEEMNVVRGGGDDARKDAGKGMGAQFGPVTCVCPCGDDNVDSYKWRNPGWGIFVDHMFFDVMPCW